MIARDGRKQPTMINDQDQSAGGVPDGGAVQPTASDHVGTTTVLSRTAVDRVKDVLSFKEEVFEEIATDPRAMSQGLGVATIAYFVGDIWFVFGVLLSVPLTLISTAILAGIYSLVARLYSKRVLPYTAWLRVTMFATTPFAFGIVPLVGDFAGWVYFVLLMVVSIRAVANIPLGAAIAVFLIAALVPFVLAAVVAMTVGLTFLGGLFSLLQSGL